MVTPTKKPATRKPRAPRVVKGAVAVAVDKLLATLELDEVGKTNAAIAQALAAKLDEARQSDSGAIAMAISGIAKELRAVIESILATTSDNEEFVADLFSPVGDTPDT